MSAGATSVWLRTDGDVLDAARSLAQCGVYDGELLILTAATEPTRQPPVRSLRFGGRRCRANGSGHAGPASDDAVVGVLWSAAAVAVLLGRNAFAAATAMHRCRVCHGDLGARRRGGAPTRSQPGGDTGCRRRCVGGAEAQLAVPALPGFLLAMSAVSAISLIAWRLLDCGTATFLPLAGMTMAAAAASARRGAGMAVPGGRRAGVDDGVAGGSGGRPAAGGATVRTVRLGVARRCRAPCGERSADPDLARHGNGWGIRGRGPSSPPFSPCDHSRRSLHRGTWPQYCCCAAEFIRTLAALRHWRSVRESR